MIHGGSCPNLLLNFLSKHAVCQVFLVLVKLCFVAYGSDIVTVLFSVDLSALVLYSSL